MKSASRLTRDPYQREFVKIFDRLTGRYGRWEVWQDWVKLIAIEISNAVDNTHSDERGKAYAQIASKYNHSELSLMAEAFGHIVDGMEANQDQDFLGELYMALELGNDSAGQFFTPYCVCRLMAEVNGFDAAAGIAERGWVGVNDPACGAGATLVALANKCKRDGVNYQTSVLFVAQDIDAIVGMMCYIQLSLLGCPGYVVIGDTLAHPASSYDGKGLLPCDDLDVWFTPMFYRDIWACRRMLAAEDVKLREYEAALRPADMSVASESQSVARESQYTRALPQAKQPEEASEYRISNTGQLSFF